MGRKIQNRSLKLRLNHEILRPNCKMTIIVSGGMDSTTLLYYALSKTISDKVIALSVDYGQKHKKELEQAKEICRKLDVEHRIIDLKSVSSLLKSSLTSDEKVPHGHYAEDNMKATVVPNRNAIMLSLAYGVAISNKSKYLLYGAHAGDHFIYPDCRPEFVKALDKAFRIGNKGFGNTKIKAPFNYLSKSEIVTLGIELGVPYEYTWSCYEGQKTACGECGTCTERVLAFADNNVKDPIEYEKGWEWTLSNALALEVEFQKTKRSIS